MAYIMAQGWVENKLRKEFRNEICPCGSGKKFKRCCQTKVPFGIPVEVQENMDCFNDLANKYRELVVYINKKNFEAVKNDVSRDK